MRYFLAIAALTVTCVNACWFYENIKASGEKARKDVDDCYNRCDPPKYSAYYRYYLKSSILGFNIAFSVIAFLLYLGLIP